jgi:hypothetical protein
MTTPSRLSRMQDVKPAIAKSPAKGRKFTQPHSHYCQDGGCDSASTRGLLRALNTPAVR